MHASENCRLLEKGIAVLDHTYLNNGADSQYEFDQPTRSLGYHLKTLFLFTKSDFKTVLIPQSIFAITAVLSTANLTTSELDRRDGPANILGVASRVPHMLAWIWLYLLVEDIANQRIAGSIVEDSINKPWRPLPSKRLAPEQARSWLLVAIAAAVGLSLLIGGFTPGLVLLALVWMYNDLDGSNSNIWLRNALNAGGLMSFSWGALEALSGGELLPRAKVWIGLTGAIILTTVHAQDLPDIEGDLARGRLTVPLLYGETVARVSLAIMVIFWSAVCPAFWDAAPWGWAASLGIGGVMSGLALQKRGQRWDEMVWKLWCLWVATLYLLPALSR